MTKDAKPSPERIELEESLRKGIKDVVQKPFDLKTGVKYLADFIEEFKLQKTIKKGVWIWGEMEFSPSALTKPGLIMSFESELAFVTIGFANVGYNTDKTSVNAEIRVTPNEPDSAISEITLGYDTEVDGSKSTGSFVIRSKHNNVAFTVINFHKFPPYTTRISVSNGNPATPAGLKKWIAAINPSNAWEKCSEFILQASGLETGL